MKRNVFFVVFVGFLTWIILGFTSCKTVSHEILLGDVISFSDDAITSYDRQNGQKHGMNYYGQSSSGQSDPYVLFSPAPQNADSKTIFQHKAMLNGNKNKMMNFIENTQMGKNTAGIYAIDLALDRIKYVKKHILKRDINTKYYIIYLTDGLDNISCQVAMDNGQGFYKNPEKYKTKMEKKITKVSGCKKKVQNPFEIYPVLYTGTDLRVAQKQTTKDKFKLFVDENMGWSRGSSRGIDNAPNVIADTSFDKILDIFKDEFNASGFEFHVPKGYIGKEIKMEFDDGNKKTILFANFIKKGGKYLLKDINMENGLASDVKLKPGKTLELKAINNKDKNAKLAIFRLEKPKCDGKSYYIDKNKTAQFVNDKGVLINNSEYDSQSKGAIDTYFIVVLDASRSLGDDLKYEINTALQMVQTITQGAFDSERNVEDKNSDRK